MKHRKEFEAEKGSVDVTQLNHKEWFNSYVKWLEDKYELFNRIEALEDKSLVKKTDENLNSEEAKLSLVKQQVTELLKEADLPDLAEWVSVDEDGEIWCHNGEPKTLNHDWYHAGRSRYVAIMNLNGADWKECCWKISDLLGDSDVKKNFTTEYSVSDTQPDWKNLLTKDDAMIIYPAKIGIDTTKYLITHLNRKIHDRIKPLLEDYECDSFYLEEAKTRIAELKAENQNLDIRFQLSEQYANTIQNQLLEAKAKIAELEAENPNTIEVPFELDEDIEFLFPVKNMGLFTHLSSYCKRNNIDPKQIKRMTLEMKSEVEE